MIPAAEIRGRFLAYFQTRDHHVQPSASLIPEDRTVLLTIAGMLPFKPYFLGKKTPPFKRATSSQKCIRTNDIDNVGRTPRHHTFFEMLGNFSFGDYFKEGAIEYAWTFLTQELGIPEEKLFVSVFREDEESFNIWTNTVGVSKDRIVRLGEKDNFWAAGPTGPCGPCSEIYYDYGKDPHCKETDCLPGCECNRFVEVWNLVFMEYNRDEAGRLTPLPQKNIDTGMGLERIAAVVAGVRSNFETDLFIPILKELESLSSLEGTLLSRHVIADHSRAMVFMVGDGIYPSNDGRGYILKKIIRRIIRHGKLLGINRPFLEKMARIVIAEYGTFYPELVNNEAIILDILRTEESNFSKTLGLGLALLRDILKNNKLISGEDAFKLFDTYGFPLELTLEIAAEEKASVDMTAFNKLMEGQRGRARQAATFYKDPSTSSGQDDDKPKGGESMVATNDEERLGMARNHSGTHLLQAALRKILGKHVTQAGSLVSPDRLRFDFTHPKALTPEQITAVETLVNQYILQNVEVSTTEKAFDDAIAEGAMALFTEKYAPIVRVVKMGDCSMELCGGTHVTRTGDIGGFLILSEAAISSGVRRIEAVTGMGALAKAQELKNLTNTIANTYKLGVADIPARMEFLAAQLQQAQKQLASLQVDQLIEKAKSSPSETIASTPVLIAKLDIADTVNVKDLIDGIFPSVGTLVALFLVSASEQKIAFTVKVNPELQNKGVQAGTVVKTICALLEGNGGGRPDFAQGGGKAIEKVDLALTELRKILTQRLS
jgi:alanyl-tRNA synthetase